MWNPNAGQPGPHPYPPNVGYPGGANPAHPPPVNPAYPPGPLSNSPRGSPGESSFSPLAGPLILHHNQGTLDANPRVPTHLPTHHLFLAPGMGGPGMVMDKKMRKKMKKAHKKTHKHHKHGKHSSSSSSSSSSDSD
ncbi:hypothetical protein VULLAG_LOCUS2523 [Vulpes lagopus]